MRSDTADGSPVCRIGFIGTGGVATRHAGVLAGFDDVELVAATDVDPARSAGFAEAHGLRAVPDVDALLEQDLDAVYVCVPPFAHGGPERAAAAAGLPVFVEKPLAADLGTAERIGAELTAAGVLTRVGLHWRCAEHVGTARELLAGRTVRAVNAWWLDKVPPVAWWSDRERSGGPLVEQAVHVLDAARVLVGEVREVTALSAGPLDGGSVDTATAGLLRFADGAVGTVSTTCALEAKYRAGLEVVADGLVVALGEDWLEVQTGAVRRRHDVDPMLAKVAADRAFVDAVRGRDVDPDRSPPDHAEALRSHRLACALAAAVDSGRTEAVR
jgi:myo-inositol 2-dehydrogenase / D-chiro-inositol 1-dehydrogenase